MLRFFSSSSSGSAGVDNFNTSNVEVLLYSLAPVRYIATYFNTSNVEVLRSK